MDSTGDDSGTDGQASEHSVHGYTAKERDGLSATTVGEPLPGSGDCPVSGQGQYAQKPSETTTSSGTFAARARSACASSRTKHHSRAGTEYSDDA